MGTVPMSCYDWHAGTTPVVFSGHSRRLCFPREALLGGPKPCSIPSMEQQSQARGSDISEPGFWDSGLSFSINFSGDCG